jgi:hypothetical protein
MKSILKIFTVLILLLVIFSCSDKAPATVSNTDTFEVSGTLKTENPSAGSRNAYFRLLKFQEEIEATPLYLIKSTAFADISGVMTATYSYSGIARGRYDVVIFIDINNNATINSNLPDSGDLYIKTSFIFNDKDLKFDVNNTQWLTY